MKMHKGQMLLPKAKSGHQTGKWARNVKNCTPTSTSQSVGEQVELLSTTCGKADVLLSKAQLVPIWSDEGILRQALMSAEKIKCEKSTEENVAEVEATGVPSVNTSLVTITVSPQQPLFTSVGSSQVIMMSDLGPSQIILSGEPISTVTWQSTEKKDSESASTVLQDESATFSTLDSMSVLNHNVMPALLTKERKNPLKGNPLINAGYNIILPDTGKKINIKQLGKLKNLGSHIKHVGKCKKLNPDKQILLKPTSSLLSSIALNYSLDESKEPSTGNNELLEVTDFTAETSPPRSIVSDVTLVSTNQHPISSSSVIMSSENSDNNFNSVGHRGDVTLGDLSMEKTNYSHCQHIGSEPNDHILYHSNSNDNLLRHPVSQNSSILTTPTSMQNHVRIINLNTTAPLIQDSMLIDSGQRIMPSANQTSVVHSRLLPQNQEELIHQSDHPTEDIINGDGFHRGATQVMLTSDIDHNTVQTGHSDSGYTERLLSQLSNDGALPTISSSQVSSVLSALVSEPNNKSQQMNGLDNLQRLDKTQKGSVKSELDTNEYSKDESTRGKNKTKPDEEKWKLWNLNNHNSYRCTSCMYLSLDKANVIRHFGEEHDIERSELIGKQLAKKHIACIGCNNIFYSKHSVQVHLLQDHNVNMSELSEILNVVFVANKLVRSGLSYDNNRPSPNTPQIRNPPTKIRNTTPTPAVTVNKSVQPQTNILPNPPTASALAVQTDVTTSQQTPTTTASLQPLTRTVPVLSESTTSSGVKSSLESTERLPSTPNFSLFTEINNVAEKKESSECEKNNKGKGEEHDVGKKRGRPRGNHVLKIVSKKVKLSEIKTEAKECTAFRCGVDSCVIRLSTEANLEFHRQCHSATTGSGTFSCPNCSHTTAQWSSMSIHLWKEHQIDIELFSCDQCNYKTNSYSKLINQHCKIHGDERPYLCDLCGKGFKTTKQLRNHKVIHRARVKSTEDGTEVNSAEKRHYPCKVCNRSFADARILRHHIENVHNKLRRFLCSFCGHAASSRSSLRMHIRQHTGEKPFSCEECEYTTSDHNSLRRHKMRHSRTFPYRCPHCEYACIQSTTYKTHLKNKHPGMNEGFMFDCPECPFRTIKKDNFLTHTAEHALGGDPRMRRKKQHTSQNTSQNVVEVSNNISEESIAIVNLHSHTNNGVEGSNNISEESIVIVNLHSHTNDDSAELIVPEPNPT